jgi:hypothetical protein
MVTLPVGLSVTVGLVPGDLLVAGAGKAGDGGAVGGDVEAVLADGDGNDAAVVGEADAELLAGDLDHAAGDDPLHHGHLGWPRQRGGGQAGAAQPGPLRGGER